MEKWPVLAMAIKAYTGSPDDRCANGEKRQRVKGLHEYIADKMD